MMERFDKDRFVERLRSAVELRGGSITAAALRCGMPAPSLECYLSGQNLPGAKALAGISTGLGVSIDWLLFGSGNGRRAAR